MRAERDDMRAVFSLTTTFLLVMFVILTFTFFGINIFIGMSYSADVVLENMEHLYAIDAVHSIESCLAGEDRTIWPAEVSAFSLSDCRSSFPGLDMGDYEYMLEDLEDSSLIRESPGYRKEYSGPAHSIFINIAISEDDVHVGRLHVQKE